MLVGRGAAEPRSRFGCALRDLHRFGGAARQAIAGPKEMGFAANEHNVRSQRDGAAIAGEGPSFRSADTDRLIGNGESAARAS